MLKAILILVSGSISSISCINLLATPYKASLGQLWNQSIEQALISPGNFLDLILIFSPTGEKHKIIFKFFLILSKKYYHNLSYESGTPYDLASFLKLFIIASTSSLGNKS